jgi:hypothetical protein
VADDVRFGVVGGGFGACAEPFELGGGFGELALEASDFLGEGVVAGGCHLHDDISRCCSVVRFLVVWALKCC